MRTVDTPVNLRKFERHSFRKGERMVTSIRKLGSFPLLKKALILNLSRGGARLLSSQKLETGDRVEVFSSWKGFFLPEHSRQRLAGVVRHKADTDDENMFEYGISFDYPLGKSHLLYLGITKDI